MKQFTFINKSSNLVLIHSDVILSKTTVYNHFSVIIQKSKFPHLNYMNYFITFDQVCRAYNCWRLNREHTNLYKVLLNQKYCPVVNEEFIRRLIKIFLIFFELQAKMSNAFDNFYWCKNRKNKKLLTLKFAILYEKICYHGNCIPNY